MNPNYKLAIFGSPVSHSLSPTIHTLFAEQAGISIEYTAIECTEEGFAQAVTDFILAGGHGANVTLPFKQQAYALAAVTSPAAKLAAAANTLVYDKQKLVADNTDGQGLVQDLVENLDLDLSACRILLLGAGGAVRGVLGPLLQNNPRSMTITNRTMSKAQQLAKHFARVGTISCCSYPELAGQDYDIIINGTSTSISGQLPPMPADFSCHQALVVYDMMYSKQPTAFIQWAQQQGALSACDGLGMLLEQAAASFYLWTRHHPDISPVRKLLLDSPMLYS